MLTTGWSHWLLASAPLWCNCYHNYCFCCLVCVVFIALFLAMIYYAFNQTVNFVSMRSTSREPHNTQRELEGTRYRAYLHHVICRYWWAARGLILNPKTDVAPAILSCDVVAQLYRETKSQVWHGVTLNSLSVTQVLLQTEECSILCNFVARMLWTLIGQ